MLCASVLMPHIAECCLYALLMLQGEAGTGNVVEAVRHCRAVMGAVKALQAMDDDELYVFAKDIQAPIELVRQVSSSQCARPASLQNYGVSVPKSRLQCNKIDWAQRAWTQGTAVLNEAPVRCMIAHKQRLPAAKCRGIPRGRT